MRRLTAWGLSAVLLAGVGAVAPQAALAGDGAARAAVSNAQQRLADARTDLRQAVTRGRQLRTAADTAQRDADRAEQDLSQMAREAYRGGASLDLYGLASLIDAPDPADTMRRATVLQLLVEHQDSQVAEALAAVGQADLLRDQADELTTQARRQVRAAQSALQAARRNQALLGRIGSKGGGSGTAELTKRCLAAQTMVDICATPPWSEQNLLFDTVVVERFVHVQWPAIRDVGGWRPSDPYPDHPSGRAVDIMMPNSGSTPADVALGDDIAAYFQQHAADYGLYYMIWRQRIWKAGDPIGQWTAMSDRGSPTANHLDHVHITVTDGRSGTGWQLAEQRSADLQKLIKKPRSAPRATGR